MGEAIIGGCSVLWEIPLVYWLMFSIAGDTIGTLVDVQYCVDTISTLVDVPYYGGYYW